MLPPGQTQALITRLIREDWGRILSSLVSSTGDYDLAEDSLQDAVLSALEAWSQKGRHAIQMLGCFLWRGAKHWTA